MTKIFFFSTDGYLPMKDPLLKHLIDASYGWQDDGESWVYGVCIPRRGVDPLDVAARLEVLGVHVLPGLRHPDNPDPKDEIKQALKNHVAPTDKAHDIVKKMADKCGMPIMRPHYF